MNTKFKFLLLSSLIIGSVEAEKPQQLSPERRIEIACVSGLLRKINKLRDEYMEKHPDALCLWARDRFSEFAGTPIYLDSPDPEIAFFKTTNRKIILARDLHKFLTLPPIFILHLGLYDVHSTELAEVIKTLENILNDFKEKLKS